jgi:hypothetical protein
VLSLTPPPAPPPASGLVGGEPYRASCDITSGHFLRCALGNRCAAFCCAKGKEEFRHVLVLLSDFCLFFNANINLQNGRSDDIHCAMLFAINKCRWQCTNMLWNIKKNGHKNVLVRLLSRSTVFFFKYLILTQKTLNYIDDNA